MEIKNVEIVNNCSGPHQETSDRKPLEDEANLSIPEDDQFQKIKKQKKKDKRVQTLGNQMRKINFQKYINKSISRPLSVFEMNCSNRFQNLKRFDSKDDVTDINSEPNQNKNKRDNIRKRKKSKKLKNLKRKKARQILSTKHFETSEGIYPEVIRCRGCLKWHTPSRKFCRWFINKKRAYENWKSKTHVIQEYLDHQTLDQILNFIKIFEGKSPVDSNLKPIIDVNTKVDRVRLRGGAEAYILLQN